MTHSFDSHKALPPRLTASGAVIHIHFAGLDFDLLQSDLNIDLASGESDIKHAVARSLGISRLHLECYALQRHDAGDLSLSRAVK